MAGRACERDASGCVGGRARAAFNWGVGRLHSLAIAPDGMTAAAGGSKNEIVVWDLDGDY